ncbi:RNA 2',3'-cyclic phosphodiesterase [Marinobacterium zhoushanense]|uniref:RNA 2',3'-cyclic phosphodiesterase n=1 Tax=Marinobacterium zhoushanense TaxID=1679163 RepID=A0ABQ1KAK6_9GAMM|nr:RNA 2',3'-cyclic phosphodiesterase [Marinobacterium zhoushanense]GGB90495.1 RNA 2',3'-cyclic phosphodiesterase [Marinobacterium zhoushanense]
MGEHTQANRLFIAIELNEALQERIALRRPELRGLRWIAPERLHLTLAFIGPLPEPRLQLLDEALDLIRFKSFELKLDRIGAFSKRTLWLGCEPCSELMQLHQQIRSTLQALAVKVDTRPYQPHITIAYSRAPLTEQLIVQLDGELVPEPMTMRVDQFVLKNSILSSGSAPLHQTLRLYNPVP